MEETSLRPERLLFPAIVDLAVLSVDVKNEAVHVEARSTAAEAVCPSCGSHSSRIHSSYLRFPADVPSAGRRVVLCLWVRRLFCRNVACGRLAFVEQLPGLTRRHSRWTERLRSTLAAVGLALAGSAGARMARVFGVSVSRSTVLRLLTALPEPEAPSPREVGVDEYATRKGRVYGTVLVDCETRRPVDLLPDREASNLAEWLAKHPGIEVICRDRAPFFAEGATAGASQAIQVADRWHLWHNLGEAAEGAVSHHRQCLRALVLEPAGKDTDDPTPPEGSTHLTVEERPFANRIRARTRHRPRPAGSRPQPPLHRASTPYDPPHRQEPRRRGQAGRPLPPPVAAQPNLRPRRVQALPGRPLGRGLHQRLEALGRSFPWVTEGSYGRVSAYLREMRTSPRSVTAQPPAPRVVTRWILSRPESLTEIEQLRLKAVLANCPELDALTGHVRSFARMLTERQGERLPQWLDAVRQDDLPSLHTLAAGIDRDRDAVIAGLTLPWNSGVVEGHVNRIKMLRRQMFGRAGFALLR
ncbi:ISL3 family transposase [Streptomyces sp. M92]|uniref:ISL3 family transposase n=1 Tax=Streptomyces sp. M92 TaxID=2944250 RepID=UPI0023498099|nr:ISL3 family transposase [Streptomyces sp. M92]WCN05111.1 ISL3 family transposase [Streptomyces sp. M92]